MSKDEEDRRGLLANVDDHSDTTTIDSRSFSEDDAPTIAGRRRSRSVTLLATALIASLLLNTALLVANLLPLFSPGDEPSHYAGLTRIHEEPYVRVTKYASSNDTLQDQLWHDIDIDAGVVALSDTFAASKGLRTAQRFPWDESKGIYILHGFHNLHCLKIIHLSLSEYRTESPQSRNWHHVSHCVDALRRQILCDADDTPRATERRKEIVSGVGQHRMCRSWNDLENWARKHTACYKRPEKPEESTDILERFKHCPEGSGYVIDHNYVPSDEFLVGLPEESLEDV